MYTILYTYIIYVSNTNNTYISIKNTADGSPREDRDRRDVVFKHDHQCTLLLHRCSLHLPFRFQVYVRVYYTYIIVLYYTHIIVLCACILYVYNKNTRESSSSPTINVPSSIAAASTFDFASRLYNQVLCTHVTVSHTCHVVCACISYYV